MKNKPLIVIKPRKKEHGAPHGGAWKVAYADFVTALMAFFLVMWLVGQDKAVRQAVAANFRDPGAYAEASAASLLEGGSGLHDEASPAAQRALLDQQALERVASEIEEAIKKMPALAALRDQIEIRMTAEGLRIELQESASSCFFDTGSAHMTPQAEELFGTIGRELSQLPNGVLLEGHTDSRQYAREGYSNWELAADRANAVRRVMGKSGLSETQLLEVRGYADKQLRNPADPFDARNRRVSILVRRAAPAPAPASSPQDVPQPGSPPPVAKARAEGGAQPEAAARPEARAHTDAAAHREAGAPAR